METENLILRANKGELHISLAEWCHVSLVVGKETFHLGADSLHLVKAKLRTGLETEPQSVVSSDNVDQTTVTPILSLFEKHCTIFRSASLAHQLTLFFQDGLGNLIAQFVLEDSERRAWISLLR